jgi:hypothetical protein
MTLVNILVNVQYQKKFSIKFKTNLYTSYKWTISESSLKIGILHKEFQ